MESNKLVVCCKLGKKEFIENTPKNLLTKWFNNNNDKYQFIFTIKIIRGRFARSYSDLLQKVLLIVSKARNN